MSVNTESFAVQARQHWAVNLPKKTSALKSRGLFVTETRKAATMANHLYVALVHQGISSAEAEQQALEKFILLTPEVALTNRHLRVA